MHRSAFIFVGVFVLFAVALGSSTEPKPNTTLPELKITEDYLIQSGGSYSVKGTVYNPHDKAVKNVVIKYYVWKKWMGKDGHGSRIRDTGGLVTVNIKYLAPKQSAEFLAKGDDTAPLQIGFAPDPIHAEISAEWDQNDEPKSDEPNKK